MKIHVFFGVLTVVLLVIVIGSRRREAFTFDDVVGMARAMAVSDYMSAVPVLPKELRELNYDQHRDIRWRDEYTLWRREGLPFQARLFHPGYIFDRSVDIYYEVADKSFERLRYSPEFSNYGKNVFRQRIPDMFSYAGFRIRYPINKPISHSGGKSAAFAELRFVEQGVTDLGTAWDFPHGGIARAVIDPLTHSVHVALLRQRKAVSEEQKDTWNSFARN